MMESCIKRNQQTKGARAFELGCLEVYWRCTYVSIFRFPFFPFLSNLPPHAFPWFQPKNLEKMHKTNKVKKKEAKTWWCCGVWIRLCRGLFSRPSKHLWWRTHAKQLEGHWERDHNGKVANTLQNTKLVCGHGHMDVVVPHGWPSRVKCTILPWPRFSP